MRAMMVGPLSFHNQEQGFDRGFATPRDPASPWEASGCSSRRLLEGDEAGGRGGREMGSSKALDQDIAVNL